MTSIASLAHLSDAVQVPALPAVVEHVRALLARRDVAIAEVAEAFRQDPLLTAKVFKLANGVPHARSERTTSVAQAVSLFGPRNLSVLVLRAGVMSMYAERKDMEGSC